MAHQIAGMKRFCRVFALALAAGIGVLAAGTGARAQAPAADGVRVPAPEMPANLTWLNSPPLRLEKLRGKVVLIDFWEYTCVNCIRTFPYLKAWHQKYKDKGLVIIGVHTPEFEFAKVNANVTKAAKDFGLTYPVVIDSQHAVWNTWGNQYWPAKYLIDAEGNVRYYHFGEGAYGTSESWIQRLLKEANPDVELPPLSPALRDTDKPGAVCYPVTPELYLGYLRGSAYRSLANREGYQPGKNVVYRDPGKWQDGLVYVNGEWKNTPDGLITVRATEPAKDYIAIKYHAIEVNSVLRPEEGKPVKVWVYHDGKPVAKQDQGTDIRYDEQGRSYLLVDEPRMYNIIKNAKFGQRTLKLTAGDAGMGIYSFTFVSCAIPFSR